MQYLEKLERHEKFILEYGSTFAMLVMPMVAGGFAICAATLSGPAMYIVYVLAVLFAYAGWSLIDKTINLYKFNLLADQALGAHHEMVASIYKKTILELSAGLTRRWHKATNDDERMIIETEGSNAGLQWNNDTLRFPFSPVVPELDESIAKIVKAHMHDNKS